MPFVDHTQKITKICIINFEGGGGKEISLNLHISANFESRELKIYMPSDLHEPHLRSEFCDPNPENGAWGDDRKN